MDKATLNKFEDIRQKISDKIDDREYTFEERSEKWQESEKGEEYQGKTDEL